MKLEREDYMDPQCVLCGKPGETEPVQPVPIGRIMDRLREYEDRSDWARPLRLFALLSLRRRWLSKRMCGRIRTLN